MAVQSIPLPPPTSGGKAPRWTQPVSFYGQSVFSKYYAQAICVFLLLVPFLVMPVKAQGQAPVAGADCIPAGSFDANTDYFKNHTKVDSAALFSVDYKKSYKVLTTKSSVTAPQSSTYVLYQCGAPIPDAAQFPNNTVFMSIPVNTVGTLATTTLTYLEMLGKRSAVKVVDTEGLVTSPCVQASLAKGEIKGVEDKDQALRGQELNSVDVVFATFSADPLAANRTVLTFETADPGPLNRAEWLEFYSAFFNLEKDAQERTAKINNNYNCFKGAATAAKSPKPVVAWATFNAPSEYNNNTASWSLSNAAYKKALTEDAAATFFFPGNASLTTQSYADAGAFATALASVDILIDESVVGTDYANVLQNYKLTESSDLKFVKNKAVYREDGAVNPNDGRDWFSTAVAQADAVLQDIIRATHPDALPADTPYRWIRNVAKGEAKNIISDKNCTTPDSNTPIPDIALVCKDMKVDGRPSAATKSTAAAFSVILGLAAIALTL
ncbi:hypothetical protein DFQ26_008769 [Actinomortierella ambigua]|nr:hypothetical protein DFQ26_008769 [Actinomortierella ambigua]